MMLSMRQHDDLDAARGIFGWTIIGAMFWALFLLVSAI